MPLNKHFKGQGAAVMKKMKARYGAKKGKGAFYATENKMKNNPYKKLRGAK